VGDAAREEVERSHSIASAPEEDVRIELLIERLEDGEVSQYRFPSVPEVAGHKCANPNG
jgi:hypothetical protein